MSGPYDRFGQEPTATPDALDARAYEVPIVFVHIASSARQAASMAMECLDSMTVHVGGSILDAWTLPENLDLTGGDTRAGTIVYGSDNALIVHALLALDPDTVEPWQRDRIAPLVKQLSNYTFDGA